MSASVVHVRDCKNGGTVAVIYTETNDLTDDSSPAVSHAGFIFFVFLPYRQPVKRSDTVA